MPADLIEEKITITIPLEPGKRAELDALARTTARDVATLVTEAIDAYLDVQRWQMASIEEGVRQADAGEFATDAEVAAAYARHR